MKKEEAKQIIEQTFGSVFNERKFHNFIANLLKRYNQVEKVREGQFIKDSFKSFILKYKIIGHFKDGEGNGIDILEVAINKSSTLERARTIMVGEN